jgi:hypothetical protein
MQITKNEWTPLFLNLKSKVSGEGRKRLLFQLIGDLQDVTMLNFGETGIARPEEWQELTPKYADAKKGGNRTPNLILKGNLINSFQHSVEENKATLTNSAPYADEHQFGAKYKNLPARPYYPVDQSGENLTPFAEERLAQIVEEHFKT